jgi:hypothetical protein
MGLTLHDTRIVGEVRLIKSTVRPVEPITKDGRGGAPGRLEATARAIRIGSPGLYFPPNE